MTVALQASCQSVFRYTLGCTLGPRTITAQPEFVRIFGCLTALPGVYCEANDVWNVSHPDQPFTELSGDTLTVNLYNEKKITSIMMDTMANHLIAHGIPPQWIDHAYTFGLHFLNHQLYLQAGPIQRLVLPNEPGTSPVIGVCGNPI
jgi:hypothetical protein